MLNPIIGWHRNSPILLPKARSSSKTPLVTTFPFNVPNTLQVYSILARKAVLF